MSASNRFSLLVAPPSITQLRRNARRAQKL
jgi:hypothetical protein